jgi:hypothetical protein
LRTIITSLIVFLFSLTAQAAGDTIRISVKVEDKESPALWVNYIAVNKRTGEGSFGNYYGKFDMVILKSDTIHVKAQGYEPQIFCLKDSAGPYFREFTIKLAKLPYELKSVDIIAIRDFKEIEQDIQRLEKARTSDYGEYNSFKSPITALYDRFSNIGQQKTKVAEMEYEDAKRALLKELLAKYVTGDIIALSETEFDDFITYCNPDMEFIKNSSQYELIMYFKARYEEYKRYVRYR